MRELFGEWLLCDWKSDYNVAGQGRKALLLQDNCTAHHVKPPFKAVMLLFLPPNATLRIQPFETTSCATGISWSNIYCLALISRQQL